MNGRPLPLLNGEPVKAWKPASANPPFLWFEDDDGNRYLAPPSHLHGFGAVRGNVLTLRNGKKDRIVIRGPAVMDLVEALGSGRAQGIRPNGSDFLSVVVTTELGAAAAAVSQAVDAWRAKGPTSGLRFCPFWESGRP